MGELNIKGENMKLNKDQKEAELKKYRDLVIAATDYLLENKVMRIKTADFDSNEHFRLQKQQTEEHFKNGRLTRLKHWFRDLTEPHIELRNLKFNEYLNERTNYKVDIFKSYFERVDKVIERGEITTDNQFYDLSIMVDQLCQSKPVDNVKVGAINKLLAEYEKSKR